MVPAEPAVQPTVNINIFMIRQLKKFYLIYGLYYIRMWTILALSVISLLVLDFEYFLIAVGVYLLYMPVIVTIEHEYICHEYIVPKNKIIDFFMLLIFYIHQDNNISNKRNYHMTHHRYWKDPHLDPTQSKMIDVSIWRHVLGFERPVSQHLNQVSNVNFENNSNVKLLDSHARKIYWGYRIAMLILLPVHWFVVFVIYVPWLYTTAYNFHDELFHGKIKSKDSSWYLPIYSNGAWHIKHHSEHAHNYHGPGIMSKFNISWYFQKLFFVANKNL